MVVVPIRVLCLRDIRMDGCLLYLVVGCRH
nr:MAG TPA: hypothetical protein [Caudoviricetes sp.]